MDGDDSGCTWATGKPKFFGRPKIFGFFRKTKNLVRKTDSLWEPPFWRETLWFYENLWNFWFPV